MHTFDYSKYKNHTWDNEILSYVAQIHEYRGKQELYIRQKSVELTRLIEIAKIQSTESSNRIEGNVGKSRNVLDVRASQKVGLQMEQGNFPSR